MSGPVTSHREACPDCGKTLVVLRLANGTHTCHCPADDCRASFITHGKVHAEATDKFVQKCEQFGYLTALETKVAALKADVGQ